MIGTQLEDIHVRPSFYTAALQSEISQILDSVSFGRKYTPYLKIKLDSDIKRGSIFIFDFDI